MAVAVSFFAIAPDTGNEALRDLLGGDHAGTSSLGIAVTAASLQVMPGLGLTKKRLGAAVSFFLLAPYIAINAVRNLLVAHQGGTNRLGVIVTAASLLVMPAPGFTKQPPGKGCRT